ncbi:LPS assembly lipoprotein LptE [Limnobacter humi]|uniref:LPS-assembly lipoprotein LptE n=1 Tax=Limnobacter humi TaxID=1778671 RepID=A0ABT1WGB6_9BURK|nr:LPS assembly lipoprotein LptE [Limnobacter humi]MCQ8896562.1 LPS assembly lipoprotein LptE [Limnobacter humi]
MTRIHTLTALLLSALLLAACGFQLRGQYTFDFDRIELRGMEKTEMNRNMNLQMQIMGIAVNTADGAPLKLTLLKEKRDRSIVTFSASGRAREVRLTYDLDYQVTDKQGDFLIATTTLQQRRELTYSDDQILGKEMEEANLYTEMQRDIARQISARLAALKLSKRNDKS